MQNIRKPNCFISTQDSRNFQKHISFMARNVVKRTLTHFSKRLPKVFRETIIQNWVGNTQISVREHMREDLYGNR